MTTVDEIHAASTIKEVAVSKLRVDRSYQREPSLSLVDQISEDWDLVASELILVSDRGERPENGEVEGGLFVVNGQHRYLAARKLGHTKIHARVIDLRQEEDPAKLEAGFRLKTNVRLGDRSAERFKAQLRAGDEESHAIQKLLGRFDTEINLVPTMDYGINCISTIEILYRVDEGSILTDTLEVMKEAYQSINGKTAGTNIFKSIAWFILKHAEESDRSRLVEKLQVMGVAGLERRARTMQSTMAGALWVNYYRILVEAYNEKLTERNRLQWQTKGSALVTQRRSAGVDPTSSWGRSE